MSKKNKKYYPKAMLEDCGIPSNYLPQDNKNNTINPYSVYVGAKDKYSQLWTQYDLNQYCTYLEWKNLPEGIDGYNINRMLYFHGSLVGFKFGGKIYILPYTQSGELNIYGLPIKVKPITFNGTGIISNKSAFDIDIYINQIKEDLKEKECLGATLFDSIPNFAGTTPVSRYGMNQIIINDIADCLARVNINIVISSKKILLIVKDPRQAEVVKQELSDAFSSDCPFAVITNPMNTDSVQSTDDFCADDLFNTIKNYDAIRCFTEGIQSGHFGIDKKERVATGELVGNEEQINLVADQRLYQAKLFCDKMNQLFDLNIDVRLKSDDYEQEEDGRGLNKQEEEDLL